MDLAVGLERAAVAAPGGPVTPVSLKGESHSTPTELGPAASGILVFRSHSVSHWTHKGTFAVVREPGGESLFLTDGRRQPRGDRFVLQSFAPSCLTQGIMMWKRGGKADPTKYLLERKSSHCQGREWGAMLSRLLTLFIPLCRPCKHLPRRRGHFETLQSPWNQLFNFFQEQLEQSNSRWIDQSGSASQSPTRMLQMAESLLNPTPKII